jgi:hypothetical protein
MTSGRFLPEARSPQKNQSAEGMLTIPHGSMGAWLGIECADVRLSWKGRISDQSEQEQYGWCLSISVPIQMQEIRPKESRTGGFVCAEYMSIKEV